MLYNRLHKSGVSMMLEWANEKGTYSYYATKIELSQLSTTENLWSWAEFRADSRKCAKDFAELLNGQGFETSVVLGSGYKIKFPAVRFRLSDKRIREG